MTRHLYFAFTTIGLGFLLVGCGLTYEAPETREDFGNKRKDVVRNYVLAGYATSSETIEEISFGETTILKPRNYQILDSLYEIKYSNEQQGVYNSELEEQIGIQRQIIARDTSKLTYVEHYVFAATKNDSTIVNFADIELNHRVEVQAYEITEQHEMPHRFLPLYRSYLIEESFLYPGYIPSQLEQTFYTFFKEHQRMLLLDEQDAFLVHSLKIMELGKRIRTIEIRPLLEALAIQTVEFRDFDKTRDKIHVVNGVYDTTETLTGYMVVLTTPSGKFEVRFNPYYELQSINPAN